MALKKVLSGRERVKLALAHKESDTVPIAQECAGINTPALNEFAAYLKQKRNLDPGPYIERFNDVVGIHGDYVGPKCPPGGDMWGVVRQAVSYGSGAYYEICHYPLANVATVADLEKHRWPTTDYFDFSTLNDRAAKIIKEKGLCLEAGGGNIFETSWYMRGFEQIFMDLVINPELVHAIMGRVTDFYIDYARKTLAAADGLVDIYFTADDIAGQNGLLMSLDMWEEFLKPYHTRLNKAIHEFGVKVVYHSDGDVTRAVPGLLDMGIDVLQALQFDAGEMNPVHLKNTYGDRLGFQGGISVQSTLPFGTVGQVVEEVKSRIDVLGKNGGYILGTSHAVQAGTPPENLYAMFETAQNYYPFK
jgi:uroporphyrinogen decarboxylase